MRSEQKMLRQKRNLKKGEANQALRQYIVYIVYIVYIFTFSFSLFATDLYYLYYRPGSKASIHADRDPKTITQVRSPINESIKQQLVQPWDSLTATGNVNESNDNSITCNGTLWTGKALGFGDRCMPKER